MRRRESLREGFGLDERKFLREFEGGLGFRVEFWMSGNGKVSK